MPENKNIAVLSDIHGNYIALKKCIDFALQRNIRTFIFLGDYVGDLAYPQRAMSMLYELAEKYECYFIKGNKENYWHDFRESGERGWFDHDSTTGTLLYVYRNLTDKDLLFFQSLNSVQHLEFGELPALTVCHGSPRKVNGTMLPDDASTFELMEKDINAYILCGHTHVQQKIVHKGKVVLNPGSVGMPFESGGKTQFMILHGRAGAWQEEFVSLEYDRTTIIAELKEAGLDKAAPFWYKITAHSLKTGRKSQSHGRVLARAMALCQEKYGQCVWPDIPDDCWKQAYDESIKEDDIVTIYRKTFLEM